MAKLLIHQRALLLVLAALIVAHHQPVLLTTVAARVIINDAIPAATQLPTAGMDVQAEATCKALASVCALDKECCSESCLLFVCVLPYEKKRMEGLVGNAARIISSNKEIVIQEKAPTCLSFGSVCTKDKDCCSDSCLLFLCALPYKNKKLIVPMDTKQQIAIPEKAPTCLSFGSVCTKDKDCCSDSCLLFLCALPYENEKLIVPTDTKQQIAKPEKAPTCLSFGSVCTKDKDCCSDSCLLFLCALPYENEKLIVPTDTKQQIAIPEKAPTCLAFGSVCTKDKDCCSDSCLLFLCALPYENEKLIVPTDTKQKIAIPEKMPTCLPLGGVCSKDKDCCSEQCLLLICALPYEDKKVELPLSLAQTM